MYIYEHRNDPLVLLEVFNKCQNCRHWSSFVVLELIMIRELMPNVCMLKCARRLEMFKTIVFKRTINSFSFINIHESR